MERLLQRDYACVSVVQKNKLIIVKWYRKPDEHEFCEVYQMVVKAFKIYFLETLIIDANNTEYPEPEDVDWLGVKVIPMTIKCGLRHLAIVSKDKKLAVHIHECLEAHSPKLKKLISLYQYPNMQEALHASNLESELVQTFTSM